MAIILYRASTLLLKRWENLVGGPGFLEGPLGRPGLRGGYWGLGGVDAECLGGNGAKVTLRGGVLATVLYKTFGSTSLYEVLGMPESVRDV